MGLDDALSLIKQYVGGYVRYLLRPFGRHASNVLITEVDLGPLVVFAAISTTLGLLFLASGVAHRSDGSPALAQVIVTFVNWIFAAWVAVIVARLFGRRMNTIKLVAVALSVAPVAFLFGAYTSYVTYLLFYAIGVPTWIDPLLWLPAALWKPLREASLAPLSAGWEVFFLVYPVLMAALFARTVRRAVPAYAVVIVTTVFVSLAVVISAMAGLIAVRTQACPLMIKQNKYPCECPAEPSVCGTK